MAKKAARPKFTVARVAELFGLTEHHTRRLINMAVPVPNKSAGQILLTRAQFIKVRDHWIEANAVKIEADWKRLQKLRRMK